MAVQFGPLHGLLLALTPQEQPPQQAEHFDTDLRRVMTVEQLPPRLFMGYRDDGSFGRTGDGFEVAYTLDGERVLELRREGDQFWWHQWWHGLDGGVGAGPADQLGLMALGIQLFDSWQDEIERELHALGNFGWARQNSQGLVISGLPDGIPVQLTFPVNGSALEEHARFYQQLWAEPSAGLRPLAHVLFTSLPVTHRWSQEADPEAPGEWASRFWTMYSEELGLQQPLPSQPATTADGGRVITIAREGFLQVVTVVLRDLLPFAKRLVEYGIVAETRSEGTAYDRVGWGKTIAPFRALAATVGTAFDEELVFTDARGAIECVYPTATAARIYLDATEKGAFQGLDFARVLELTRQYSGVVAELDRRVRLLEHEFMSDPGGAAKRYNEQSN
jgi:hypothetical protein